jgi:alginate O-acetyltransferase complex protein AlgI
VAFVLFRADSFQQGGYIIAQMFTGFHFEYACTELAMRQLTPVFLITLAVALIAALPVKGALQVRLKQAQPITVRCLTP